MNDIIKDENQVYLKLQKSISKILQTIGNLEEEKFLLLNKLTALRKDVKKIEEILKNEEKELSCQLEE